MNKAGKITLLILGILIVLVVLLSVFRGSVIGYILKKVVSERSNGKVELILDSFHMNIINRHMSVKNPTLQFTDLYMDEQKSIRINKLAFKKIEIDKLNVWSLIFEQDIIASLFLIEKPVFWLSEEGVGNKSSFHPEKLIKALNQNPDVFSGIKIRIHDIEIHYGSIMLSEYATPDIDPGLVDFTILLEHFDTHPDSAVNPNRILYSDEFWLKLRHLKKELKSGYALSIDSALFSSRHRDLIIDGVSLQPGPKIAGKNNIGIQARKLAFNNIGLNEIRGLDDLNLRSVVLSEGVLVNYANKVAHVHDTTESNAKGVNQLIKVLYDFRLDSISISNFDYYYISNKTDTLLAVDEIDFLITGMLIDSAMFQDLFWNLHYDDILLHTGSFSTDGLIPGYTLDYNSLYYSNDERSLQMDSIHVTSSATGANQAKTNLIIPAFSINGLSMRNLQKREKQHLSFSFINPEGNLDITSLFENNKPDPKKNVFPGYLYLDKIELSNGNFHVVKDSSLKADLAGLNLRLTDLHLPETKNDQFRLKNISVQYDHFKAKLQNELLSVSSGNMNYEMGQLSLQNILLKQNTPGGNNKLNIKVINITNLDKERLMYDHELYFDNLSITKPDLSGHFTLAESHEEQQQNPTYKITAPFSFHINSLVIKNGKLNTSIIYKDEPVTIKTGYNLISGPFYANKNDSLQTLLDTIDWLLELNNLETEAVHHNVKVKKVVTDSYRSEFRLTHLDIYPSPGTKADSGEISIRDLSLPTVSVKGLDYDLLFYNDSIVFRSLYIEHPYIDVILLVKNDSSRQLTTTKPFNPRDYLIFSYDTVEMNNLHIKVEKQGITNNEFFALKEVNFHHLRNSNKNGNLIDDFMFNFEEFNFYDSITHHFLNINKGSIDSEKGTLSVKGIRGSNMAVKEDGSADAMKPGMSFVCSEVELSRIDVERALPSRIKAGKLEVQDFDLNLIQKPLEAKQKTEFRVNLGIMKKFSYVITRMQLDTALLNDISFNIHSLNDTAENIINIDSIGILIENVQVDTSMANEEKPVIIDLITIDLKGKTQISKDSLYEFQTWKLHYNFPDQKITIDSFSLTPLFQPEEFFKRAKYQTDRVILSGHHLEIDDIKLNELLSNNHLHISNIRVDRLNTEMYRDKHYPIKPGTYKPLPREQLMNIKRAFTVDSIHVTNAYLKYLEMDATSDEPGEVFLDQLNVTAYNLTNQLREDEKKDLILDLHARIMGQTLMSLKVHFPLNPDTVSFWLTGTTEKLDLTSLNPLTTNLLGLGIVKGIGRSDITYISGNDSTAKGSLIFRYKKLRVLPYSRKKEKLKKGVLSPLISFMINDLVVKSNNPKFARKPRVGQVYFERDTQKSVVNYVWKSVLSGLMSTMGFNTKAQKQERKEVKKEDKKN